MERDRLAATIAELRTGFDIGFDIKVKKDLVLNEWYNLFHLTKTNENCCNDGDRIPGVWFKRDHSGLAMYVSCTFKHSQPQTKVYKMAVGKWYRVRILSLISLDNSDIQGYVDDKHVWTIKGPRKGLLVDWINYESVRICQSDPWHRALDEDVAEMYTMTVPELIGIGRIQGC